MAATQLAVPERRLEIWRGRLGRWVAALRASPRGVRLLALSLLSNPLYMYLMVKLHFNSSIYVMLLGICVFSFIWVRCLMVLLYAFNLVFFLLFLIGLKQLFFHWGRYGMMGMTFPIILGAYAAEGFPAFVMYPKFTFIFSVCLFIIVIGWKSIHSDLMIGLPIRKKMLFYLGFGLMILFPFHHWPGMSPLAMVILPGLIALGLGWLFAQEEFGVIWGRSFWMKHGRRALGSLSILGVGAFLGLTQVVTPITVVGLVLSGVMALWGVRLRPRVLGSLVILLVIFGVVLFNLILLGPSDQSWLALGEALFEHQSLQDRNMPREEQFLLAVVEAHPEAVFLACVCDEDTTPQFAVFSKKWVSPLRYPIETPNIVMSSGPSRRKNS